MTRLPTRLVRLAALLFTGLATNFASAQPAPPQSDLFRRVEALDTAVFDAFNRCEIAKLESYFSLTLEFYHDKNGVTWTRADFIDAVKKNVCGKFRRELVPGTLEVYTLGDYGAVYSGTHRFCETNAKKCQGTGRFLHIWENKNGDWKITRVVSYDHRPLP